MTFQNFLKTLFSTSRRSVSNGSRTKTQKAFRPQLEALDERVMPVVNAVASYPTMLSPGGGYDDVVQVFNGGGGKVGTGSLLASGRHILTAAHVVDVNGDGVVDTGTFTLQFDLPGKSIPIQVSQANVTVGPGWDGTFNHGSDIAIIDLGELSPFIGGGREIYRGRAEAGRVVEFVGYGNTNNVNPTTGAVLDGSGGATTGAFGTKRIGFNRIDSIYTAFTSPFFPPERTDEYLRFDLDIPGLLFDPGVTGEAICAPGDSGGPMLLFNQIVGVCSGGTNPIQFLGTADYTRVSSFAGWIDSTVSGPYELVVDMNNQLAGNTGGSKIDSIELRRSGNFLEVFVNGQRYLRESLNNISSITVRGSNDADNLTVSPDLGKQVTFDGGSGNNLLIIGNVAAASSIDLINGLVGVQTGGRSSLIIANNIQRLTATGDARDTVNVLSVRSDLPVSVAGVGTVRISTPQSINGLVDIFGYGVTNLTATDTNSAATQFSVTKDHLDFTVGSRRTVNYSGLFSLVVNGGSRGNEVVVSSTPVVPVTINTGFGADKVYVWGTNGTLTINGQDSKIPNKVDGFDTVIIGFLGTVRDIQGSVIVTNAGAYSNVTVDDSRDTEARIGLLYTPPDASGKPGPYHVVSGLAQAGAEIILKSKDVASLTILGGTGGNTFRIHDTPTSNVSGGAITTVSTGSGSDFVTIDGTTGTLRVNGGLGVDQFRVLGLRAGKTVFLNGGDGSDEFLVGDSSNPSLAQTFSSVRGTVNVDGGSGTDRLIVDDAAWGSVGNYTIGRFEGVKNTFVNNAVRFEDALERIDFYSRSGETTNVMSAFLGEIHLFNGPGNGVGTLNVDDRSGLTGATKIGLYADRIVKNYSLGSPREIFYSGYESLNLTTGDDTNAINVFGTSPDITRQTTIRAGAGNDTVTLYPHGADGTSSPTILTALGVLGGNGTDTFRVDNRVSDSPIDYLLNNAGGLSTVTIFGLGPAGVGAFNDIETIDILAGQGNDKFSIDALQTTADVQLRGGNGNDSFILGDNTGLAGITGRILVDGQTGKGGGGFARINDSIGTTARTYTWDGKSLRWGTTIVDVANLGSVQVIGGLANDAYRVTALGLIPLAVGDAGGRDTLRGPNAATTWNLTGANAGDLGPAAQFSAIENLIGGNAADNFVIAEGGSLSGSLDGGAGVNTLDYSASRTAGSGPVSRYLAEGNANDSVGNNHGIIHGDLNFVPGQVGQAVNFDGVGDYVDLGNDASLDLSGSTSVSMWVRLNSLDHYKFFFADFDSLGGTVTQGSLGTDLDATVFAWYQSYTDGSRDTLAGTTPIQLNQWFRLSVVRDDIAKTVRLYVNSVEEASLSYAGKTVVPLQSTKFLGGSALAYPADFIDGQLDDVGIYNRALSVAEIQTQSLVSRFAGEGNANDSVGNNHGVIHGNLTFVPGKFGQAFDFHGVTDYVDLGSDASLDLPGNTSVALWVRLETLNNYKYFLADFNSTGGISQGSLGTTAAATAFAWYQSYTDGTSETLAGTTPIQLNQWFHLAVVRNEDAKTVRLFVNGVEDASISYAGKTVVPLQANKILGGSKPDIPRDAIDGQLDEVGIYNRVLSVAEIQTLANSSNSSSSDGVIVNLQLGTATGLSGGIARIQNVIGSSGDDILVGNGGNVLTGGAGRDILIAGALASTLNGGDGDDILIGGTTNYDLNASALLAIRAEWTRTDRDYATRAANLSNGTNGVPILKASSVPNSSTVHTNSRRNTLTGGAGQDWFFGNVIRDTMDIDRLAEQFVPIFVG